MTSRIGSSPSPARVPSAPSNTAPTAANQAKTKAATGAPELRITTPGEDAANIVAQLYSKDVAVGKATEQLFDALVDRRMGIFKSDDFKGTRDDATTQEFHILSEIKSAASGRPSGELVVELKALRTQAGYGPEVNAAAASLTEAMASTLDPVAIPYKLADGPMKLPFTVQLDGKSVAAELVGEVRGNTLSSARVNVNGKQMYLTDGALTELLGRAGLGWSGEASSQTEVMSTGLFGLGGVHQGVTYDGGGFRMLGRDDFNGAPVYFHKAEIGLVSPG